MTAGAERATALPALPATWPLAGRDEALQQVVEAAGRRPAAVVVVGPLGSGRTRFAREAAVAATGKGGSTVWVTATRSTRRTRFGATAHLLPDGVSAEQPAADVVRAVAAGLAEGPPVVLVVDDAELLDDGSAGLLLHLAASCPSVLVLVTLRQDADPPDAVRALWKDGFGPRLRLSPLSPEDAGSLLAGVLGAPVEQASLLRLLELTGGFPLYLREAVLQALAAGGLVLVEGLWRWDGAAVSPDLLELSRHRMAQMSPPQRDIGELLGTTTDVPVRVLLELVSEDALAHAVAHGMVVVSAGTDPVARLASPIHVQVMRELLPRTTRARRLAELARVLRDLGPRNDGEGLLLALWSLDADLPVEADVLAPAAATALRAGATDDALTLAALAVADGGPLAAHLTLAGAHRLRGHASDAETVLARIENQVADSELAERYLLERCNVVLEGLGRSDEVLGLLERAAGWRADTRWVDLVTALRLRPMLHRARFTEVIDQGLRLVDDDAVDDDVRALAASPVGLALVKVGRLAEALAVADTGAALSGEPQDGLSSAALECHRVRVAAQWCRGEWAEGEPVLRAVHDAAARSADAALLGPTSYVLGLTALSCGDVDGATRWLRESVGHLTATDRGGYLGPCLARLAQAEALAGRHASGADFLARARATAADRPDEWLREIEVAAADVWVMAAAGRTAAAQDLALATATRFAGQPSNEAIFLHDALRLGAPVGRVRERLVTIGATLDSALVRLFAEHASAVGDASALEEVAQRFAAVPARLLAAECAFEAAEAHTAAGRPSAARRATGLAERLLTECPGAATPGVRGASPLHSSLTRREHEVALLAATGLSNADIARQLVVSERTVESHVLRACTKLGVHSRDELRTALS